MTDQIETLTSSNISGLSGEMIIPGDKSVSHRSLILGGMAIGQTKVTGLLMGADVLATLDAVRALGVTITAIQMILSLLMGWEQAVLYRPQMRLTLAMPEPVSDY